MSDLNTAIDTAATATAVAKTTKPGMLKSLYRTAKRNPVKTAVVVAGTTGVVFCAVKLVKRVRKARAEEAKVDEVIDTVTAEEVANAAA